MRNSGVAVFELNQWIHRSPFLFPPLNGVSVGGLKEGPKNLAGECPPPDSDLSQWELFVTKTVRICLVRRRLIFI